MLPPVEGREPSQLPLGETGSSGLIQSRSCRLSYAAGPREGWRDISSSVTAVYLLDGTTRYICSREINDRKAVVWRTDLPGIIMTKPREVRHAPLTVSDRKRKGISGTNGVSQKIERRKVSPPLGSTWPGYRKSVFPSGGCKDSEHRYDMAVTLSIGIGMTHAIATARIMNYRHP